MVEQGNFDIRTDLGQDGLEVESFKGLVVKRVEVVTNRRVLLCKTASQSQRKGKYVKP